MHHRLSLAAVAAGLSALLFGTSAIMAHGDTVRDQNGIIHASTATKVRFPVGTVLTADDVKTSPDFDHREFLRQMEEQNALQRSVLSVEQEHDSSDAGFEASNDQDNRTSATFVADRVNSKRQRIVRARCGAQRPSFLDLFAADELFCSRSGEAFPVLIGGDCPISACVLKAGRKLWPGDALASP